MATRDEGAKIALDELRERADKMLETRPAETTPEISWLVGELEKTKQVIVALIDHVATQPK